MPVMTFGSLFAGIGGFDLGLERAGMICRWQVENNPFCNKILAKHWPDVKRYGDIKDVGKHNLESVDLICGGFPCQPFSVAGKQRGKEDDRYLWPEMLRVITEVKPTWIIGENVAGIIRMELDQVLFDLEDQGYEAQPLVIPACAVDAPHRRDRVWIVAHSAKQRERRRRVQRSNKDRATIKEWASDKFTRPGKNVADAQCINDDSTRYGTGKNCRQQSREAKIFRDGYKWLPESGICRVANGVSRRVDRLRALGNAVVPQIVEIIGRYIVDIEEKI